MGTVAQHLGFLDHHDRWTLRDPKHHVYTFGAYKIKPHGYVKIHTGKGTNTQTDRYWGKAWYVWNNTGGTATLRDASGRLSRRRDGNDDSEQDYSENQQPAH